MVSPTLIRDSSIFVITWNFMFSGNEISPQLGNYFLRVAWRAAWLTMQSVHTITLHHLWQRLITNFYRFMLFIKYSQNIVGSLYCTLADSCFKELAKVSSRGMRIFKIFDKMIHSFLCYALAPSQSKLTIAQIFV